MEPTARALEIGSIIADALARIESTLERKFDPYTLVRTFKLGLVSYSGFYFLPALIEKLRFEAPHVQVLPEHMTEASAYEALEALELDFAMGIFWRKAPSLTRSVLLDTSFKVIMRPGHPIAAGAITPEKVAGYPHIRLPVLDNVERMLDANGLKRHFAATSPNPLAVPFLVSQSDMLAILPSRLAMAFATVCPLQEASLPIEMPRCEIELVAHPKHDTEAGFQWFADCLRNLTLDLDRTMQPADDKTAAI
ncbi:LysR substrate-binding domain-containing protein [Bradyrhizobium pachyrhizi]|uniref:LysR substrate-binding domain-containing protein n=1 Tax=Bradyrhizobium pachyrhizi TaxID=280333 RepID=UPI0024B23F73|nr:LysR substrate-binding domain-containing protein [Bradyrhizobium pachyrhizi]WFU58325.1 LysR substrate-binding domain-containing protein [Bradyrhizobium pachyrhizi]